MKYKRILFCLISVQGLMVFDHSNASEPLTTNKNKNVSIRTASVSSTKIPTKVILDSDASSDWDDVGDIATLNSLADLGEFEILATMSSSQNGATALFMNSINTWYGRPNVPVGRRPDVGGVGGYPAQIANEYPHPLYASPMDPPLAVDLYRQTLAAQPDNSVVIVTSGYLNNLEALLKSGPDANSPLSGPDLVAKKVKYLVCTGGDYPNGGEFNFTVEPKAAEYAINNWPAGAVYVGFGLGGAIHTAYDLYTTPVTNPVRRVYVDIEHSYNYPSWGQIGLYYAAREVESQSLFNFVNVGRNHVNADGTNNWVASPDPTGLKDQKYLTEIQRFPLQEALNTLVLQSGYPAVGAKSKPGQPSNIRATIVSGNQIDLQWTDNSYNETNFVIERKINGVFTQIATVGANVTSHSDTGLTTTANVGYRVKAVNDKGSSTYTTKTVYSGGWTEANLSQASDISPLYYYYQFDNLNWIRPGLAKNISVNNDSTHGTNLTIDVKVSAAGSYGPFFIYFLYQDQQNWYRLSAGQAMEGEIIKFEKSINGVITQIGATAPGLNIGPGTPLQTWQVTLTADGQVKYFNNVALGAQDGPSNPMNLILSVTDTLSFSSGKIALGGLNAVPVWQNFSFATTLPASPSPVVTPSPAPSVSASPSPTPSASASSAPTTGSNSSSKVTIKVVSDNLCLEIKNGSLDQATCSSDVAAQEFVLTTDSSGNYTLGQSGICLTDVGGSLQQISCSGAANQSFKTTASLDGSTMIQSVSSNNCLNVAYGSTSAGAPIILYSCSGYAPNERFQFVSLSQSRTPDPVPSSTPTPAPSATPSATPSSIPSSNTGFINSSIVSNFNNLCLEQKGGSIDQTNCDSNAANQIFSRNINADGSFTIMQSGLCLGDKDGSLLSKTCSGDASQLWSVQKSIDNSSMIVNKKSGSCFNVAYASKAVGTSIILYQCNAYASNEGFEFK